MWMRLAKIRMTGCAIIFRTKQKYIKWPILYGLTQCTYPNSTAHTQAIVIEICLQLWSNTQHNPTIKKRILPPCFYLTCIWLQTNHGWNEINPIRPSEKIDSPTCGSYPRGDKQCKLTRSLSYLFCTSYLQLLLLECRSRLTMTSR